MPFNWSCPYCSSIQTVTDGHRVSRFSSFEIQGQAEGMLGLQSTAIGCSNPDCLRTTMTVRIARAYRPHSNFPSNIEFRPKEEPIFYQRLMPQGSAAPQPDYVPEAIRNDYYEACLIKDLSPKASATLTRRCLQGMIRDFAGINKARLIDEIDALRKAGYLQKPLVKVRVI